MGAFKNHLEKIRVRTMIPTHNLLNVRGFFINFSTAKGGDEKAVCGFKRRTLQCRKLLILKDDLEQKLKGG